MDSLDSVVVYAIFGGAACGLANWALRGAPDLQMKGTVKYYSLFAALGCLSGSLMYMIMPSSSPNTVGFVGGFVGSYFLLGMGNYV